MGTVVERQMRTDEKFLSVRDNSNHHPPLGPGGENKPSPWWVIYFRMLQYGSLQEVPAAIRQMNCIAQPYFVGCGSSHMIFYHAG